MTWHDLIREARERAHLSQADLAEKVGCSQATINKIENEKPRSTKFLLAIVNQLGLTASDFPKEAFGSLLDTTTGSQLKSDDDKYKISTPKYQKEIPSFWAAKLNLPNEIPIYTPTQFVDEMYLIEERISGTIKRPPFLHGIAGAYAISTDDEEMIPEIEPGDVLFVNPHQIITHDSLCVFYSTGNDYSEETFMQIKRFVGQTEKSWRASQHNPVKAIDLDKDLWTVRHRIVAKFFR